jgi:hypothetical protein
MAEFKKDRIAAGVAAGAVLLLFVFLYAMQQNLAGLSREIEELRVLNQAVLELDARHATLDGRVAELSTLPRKTASMAMENQLKAMAHATEDLDQRLDGKYSDKLSVIKTLLQEIGEDMHSAR